MKFSDIKAILNFSAFRPEPDDPLAAWRKRFPSHRSIFFGVGKSSLSWRPIAKNGKAGDLEITRSDPKETLSQNAPQLKELTDDGWCAISLNTRYVISLETNLSRRPGSEEMLKVNPRSVLGGRYERGKRYAVTHNPETNSSILFSCEEEQTRKVEAMFRETGFHVGRICCGTYVLLRHALDVTNVTKGSEKPVSTFFVVCCEGAVAALVQDQDRWLELRSRTDVYEDDLTPISDLLAPFHSRLGPETGITLVCDEPLPGLTERLESVLPNRTIKDLSQPGLLASIMAQN
jgi:hypothetical protein